MTRIYIYAVIAVLIGTLGLYAKHMTERAALAEAAAERATVKLKRERAVQVVINDAVQEHIDSINGINDRLSDDLRRLRNRPARVDEAARTECQGTTGAELSGEDAEFLTRESARADRIRAGLIACYRYADALQTKGEDLK